MSQPRMYYGCTRRTRKEDTCRRRCTRAPHGQHATGRRLRRRPPALRLRGRLRRPGSPCPAPAQAGDDYDALILRARAGDHQPALAMLRALGRRPARHPGPHPGGQLGGPARRGDAGLRNRPPARSRPPTFGWRWRALRDCAAGRKRWRSSATACAPHPPAFAAGIAMTLADAGSTSAGRGRAAGPRPPRDADAHLALAYVHARRNTPFEALHATDRARDLAPAPPTWNASMCSPCNALAWPAPRWNTPRAGPSCTRKRRCAGCRPTRWPSRCAWPRCRRATRPTGSRSPIASWRTTTR